MTHFINMLENLGIKHQALEWPYIFLKNAGRDWARCGYCEKPACDCRCDDEAPDYYDDYDRDYDSHKDDELLKD